ncbi:branched-chain amino acid ABC transporter permease [Cereibacter sphaeroides]|nr:branched-chain amino acid ABC transporter permease [Cereibacter sphaeroides]
MFNTKLLALILAAAALLALPLTVSGAWMDIANQILLASIGALALMLLTGFAGQISLGHAGLLAAGAFTAGILSRELGAPFWVGIPAAGLTGALLGVIFGLPSLRLRGIYLAVSTLALHFLVVYLGGEYETRRGFSTGILIDPPMVFGIELWDPVAWYPVLLVGAILTYALSRNLLKSRTGRAWAAIHDTEPVAAALGINVARTKLWAFVITSAITAMAGALFAYYRGFVSIEAFSLFVTIQYVAMIIIGGMGSLTGAVLGAAFVTLLPHLIEGATRFLPTGGAISGSVFAMNYAAFGLIMIAFLVFEPGGLMGIARRLKGRG